MTHDSFRIEAPDLKSLLTRSTRQRNIRLALFKHSSKVDLDSFQRLALGFMYRERPRKNQRDLRAFGLNFAIRQFDFPALRRDKQLSRGSIRHHKLNEHGEYELDQEDEETKAKIRTKAKDGAAGDTGRSIWWDPLAGHLAGAIGPDVARHQIAENYLQYAHAYADAAKAKG